MTTEGRRVGAVAIALGIARARARELAMVPAMAPATALTAAPAMALALAMPLVTVQALATAHQACLPLLLALMTHSKATAVPRQVARLRQVPCEAISSHLPKPERLPLPRPPDD